MLKIISLGPLRASIALIPLGTKGSFGMSWLFTQLVELALVHWVMSLLVDSLVRV
jgi:hypothetical protein